MEFHDEYFALSRVLEKHHAVFYTMWELGKPELTETIETACIDFDNLGQVLAFRFNPGLWDNSNDAQRAFIVSHECLHVVLNHPSRAVDLSDGERFNVAADLVVNHLLVNRFGFDRSDVDPENKYCWLDTVFPGRQVEEFQSLEFYYRLLEATQEQSGDSGEPGASGEPSEGEAGSGTPFPELVDIHGTITSEEARAICSAVEDNLNDADKQSLQPIIQAHFEQSNESNNNRGTESGNFWTFAEVGKVKKKKKWETVIKKWAAKHLRQEIKDVEQWSRRNRRFQFISSELMLPTDIEMEEIEEEKDKITVWFFQDTSGSCRGFVNRFFKAAKSLPEDRFDVKMHCFDTRVFETTLESKKLYGFGGTSFDILESYVQRQIKVNGEKYPAAVFVITDGYGNSIRPQIPERWYWFLSSNYRSCIPKECNIYNLSDFE